MREKDDMTASHRLVFPLFCLRLSVFIVILTWTTNKLIRPADAMAIYQRSYNLSISSRWLAYFLAFAELCRLSAFVAGYRKRWSYGAVLLLRAISTLVSYRQEFTPFQDHNRLFRGTA